MKRVLSVILLAVLMLTTMGCDGFSMSMGNGMSDMGKSDSTAEGYMRSAQSLIDIGDYESAAEVLKEGIMHTGSEELSDMLEEVNQMLQNQNKSKTQAFAEVTESDVTEAPTEALTEPATQPQASSVDLSGVQKQINLFLSNFSETFFDSYPCSKYEMLSFAYSHARINDDGEVIYGSWEYYISETDVNNILYKYFGVTYATNGEADVISYTSQYGTNNIRYDGDYYYFPAADGAGHGYLSVATEMLLNSDGTYTVKYDAYSLVDFWEDEADYYYGYSAAQARNSIKLNYMYSGIARVKDYTRENGVQSYQLLEISRI